jgi:hypothetical protein
MPNSSGRLCAPRRCQYIPLGVAFKAQDVTELPNPLKQKYYCSFVAKLQFEATRIRFDISFTVSQLARFCASAGTAQWAALHHLMEYLSYHSSFKVIYSRGMKLVDLLSGYADADWGNSIGSSQCEREHPRFSQDTVTGNCVPIIILEF